MCALLSFIEDGHLSDLKEFLSQNIVDINCTNKRGDGALHIVVRLGDHEALKLLQDHGADVNLANSLGDTPAILAARHGDKESLCILIDAGADLSLANKEGETCLHTACNLGDAALLSFICSQPNINIDQQDLDGNSALHIACIHGHLDCSKSLIASGATLDLPNSVCATPLHLALSAKHSHVTMYLLHAGADCDVQDWDGDAPIHFAARQGLLAAMQTLCAFGSNVDVANKQGLTPLHLAALHGHIEVIRCLCLAGCNTEVRNGDGIKAEITALKHGHNAIADLLNRLKNSVLREQFTNQLVPTSQPISRVNFKFLGHSGVGKTTLIESFQSGYFSNLFKRGKANLPVANSLLKGIASSPNNTHIEMDITPRSNSLTFDTFSYQYTRGIAVKQVSVSGVGDLALWDFSGQDTYFLVHHHFLGCTRSIYAVVINLQDTPAVQFQQASFWLSFLQARIRPSQSIGYCGRISNPLQIVVIATHPDAVRLPRDANGDYFTSGIEDLVLQLQQQFQTTFRIHSDPFVLDARAPGTNVMRCLRQQLAEMKQNVIHGIPKCTGFLEGTLCWLPNAVHQYEHFPVMDWDTFLHAVRSNVNPLAGEEHVKELCAQLQTMGEVHILHWQPQDVVVLSPQWLCEDIIGKLLSIEFITLARVTGCYTVEDFQAAFTECDASKLLVLLEQLQLCTHCENDGELEYEFPCYNMVEAIDGLWDSQDIRYGDCASYIGLRLKTPPGTTHLLHSVFPRIQVQLRLATKRYADPECDLYQWFRGSKLCAGILESMVTLENDVACGECIEIKVRGPEGTGMACFYFIEELLGIVQVVMSEICPSLHLERYALSQRQLRNHATPYCFSPTELATALLDCDLNVCLHNPWLEACESSSTADETLLSLIACDTPEVADVMVLWPTLPLRELSMGCRRALSALMDPSDPLGKDWCLLAVQLGLTDSVAHLDAAVHPSHPTQIPTLSQTSALLERWAATEDNEATLGKLARALISLGREDAVDMLLRLVPLYQLIDTEDEEKECTESGTKTVTSPTNGARTNLSR
ncbi:death-associated protein kinase dapk-1-like isoform X2 [Thrips palmi]|uniref:Death-associated protein kinase dapk-1-like isoform X2 n=1 Tax=Thrips palmi TaxID=161013 RepID=A0A6P8YWS9_THRPL|nr:death-associated protein kinase dapk-1-like isoform X2 [Thrips palmi]